MYKRKGIKTIKNSLLLKAIRNNNSSKMFEPSVVMFDLSYIIGFTSLILREELTEQFEVSNLNRK